MECCFRIAAKIDMIKSIKNRMNLLPLCKRDIYLRITLAVLYMFRTLSSFVIDMLQAQYLTHDMLGMSQEKIGSPDNQPGMINGKSEIYTRRYNIIGVPQ